MFQPLSPHTDFPTQMLDSFMCINTQAATPEEMMGLSKAAPHLIMVCAIFHFLLLQPHSFYYCSR